MKQKHFKRWEKTRARGKSNFILRDGGIIFGLIGMGIIVPLAIAIFDFMTGDTIYDKNFQFRMISGLIIAFPAGCLWGWITWEWTEWSYKKAKSKSE